MTRARIAATAASCLVVVTAACGQKGPPLPPLRPVPVAPTQVTARRVSDSVHLRFVVPAASQDPAAPVSVSRVDIYARSLPYGSPAPVVSQLVHRDFLVGSVDVRPATPPDAPPPDPAAPVDPRPAPGEIANWSEVLPAGPTRPLDLTRDQQIAQSTRRPLPLRLPPSSVAVPFSRIVLPTRYYVVVGVSARSRPGAPSAILPIRVGGSPAVPTAAALNFTETQLILTWTAPAGAPVRVYESSPAGVESPTPVQAAPITTGRWVTPVTFGTERCFTIRRVQTDGPVSTESAPAGPVCKTPLDTFPPPAPAEPRGAADTGRITLQWPAVAAADLAGYHVLRAAGPGATLQRLTQVPEPTTTYVDLTARPDVEYTYVIVAVDRAGNLSAHSPPTTITGR